RCLQPMTCNAIRFVRSTTERRPHPRGVALIMALFAILIIGGLSFTAMTLVTTNGRAGRQELAGAQAYYLARQGVADALAQFDNSTAPNYTFAYVDRKFYDDFLAGTVSPNDPRFLAWNPATQPDPPAAGSTQPFSIVPVKITAPNGGTYFIAAYDGNFVNDPQGNASTSDPNAGITNKQWELLLMGQSGNAVRSLRVWCKSNAFSLYSYFSNFEMAGDYWITGNSFTGPAHTNGHFQFSGTPAFADVTTSSNSDELVPNEKPAPNNTVPGTTGQVLDPVNLIYYTRDIGGQDAGSSKVFTNSSQFYHALSGQYSTTYPQPLNNSTSFSFAGGQPVIPLPVNGSAQATNYYNGVASLTGAPSGTPPPVGQPTPTPASTPGKQNANGGIWFDGTKGDVYIVFNSDGTASYTQHAASSSAVTVPSPAPTITTSNAVIYVYNGNVHVGGTVSGHVNVVASGNSNTNGSTNYQTYLSATDNESTTTLKFPVASGTPAVMQISTSSSNNSNNMGNGNVYFEPVTTRGNMSGTSTVQGLSYNNSSTDIFGAVANSNLVVNSPANDNANFEVDGSLMAFNGVYMTNKFDQGARSNGGSISTYGGQRGQLYTLGGIICFTQTLNGFFDPSGNSIVSGYNENYQYDPRLAGLPPPDFPTTGTASMIGILDMGALH
ncbi:MAG: hypothetical protein ACYCW6_11165, partial [Candidatus Xenobia bacterium]